MRGKNFLRGLGIGILFTAVFCAVFTGKGGKAMTDEEIMDRANKLGMITQEQAADLLLENSLKQLDAIDSKQGATKAPAAEEGALPAQTLSPLPAPEPAAEAPEVTSAPTEASADMPTAKPTIRPTEMPAAKPTTQPTEMPMAKPTIRPAEMPAAKPTQKPAAKKDNGYVTVVIEKGMWCETVSRYLQSKDVIVNAEEFSQFMGRNGYASDIQIGTFEIPKGAGYEEIARIISGS